MTLLQWDHTVHYVNELEPVINTFRENGLIAFHGGSHKLWGTYNVLSYFDLTYIEFLAIEDFALASKKEATNLVVQTAVETLPEHEAFSRVALRSDDIEDTARTLKAQGLSLSPILDGKRLDARGELIEWRMMTIDGNFHGLVYPFIIQWKGTDSERRKRLTETKIIQPHPAGNVQITKALFKVSDPVSAAAQWEKLFQLTPVEKTDTSVTLAIGDKKFIFTSGTENQLATLYFQTEAASLKGKTFTIGEGHYIFE
ncbi:VOC family protein [Bacillaceae bacterium Marseille-Q3522]|nr:VOC family protein [Bacillaceae bacterium Marseille-Q3522]